MELFEYQKEALAATANRNHVAYYHDMGLGKTFTGAEKLLRLGAMINLVVCQKSKVDDWIDHFEKNYQNMYIYDLTKKSEISLFLSDPEFYPKTGVINYDLIWRRKELLKLSDFTLMLDESSLIQHATSKRTDFIMKLKPKNVILLSGTPVGGKYENLWTQIHLLGWNISEDLFERQYVDFHYETDEGFPQKVIDGYKNEERLKKKLRDHGCHFLKTDEVYDLPAQTVQKINIPSTKEYRKFRKDNVVHFTFNEEEITLVGDSSLNQMLRERQICGQFSEDKLTAVKDLIESTNDRLIIFYNFTGELELLQHICDLLGRDTSIVNGQVKDLYAYENKVDSVTLIQYQAGAMGLNLQLANKIIYYSPPLSSELFEQSKKRIHRIGQDRPCFYYMLVCKNSIEERIYDTLAMRKDYTDKLFEMEKKK